MIATKLSTQAAAGWGRQGHAAPSSSYRNIFPYLKIPHGWIGMDSKDLHRSPVAREKRKQQKEAGSAPSPPNFCYTRSSCCLQLPECNTPDLNPSTQPLLLHHATQQVARHQHCPPTARSLRCRDGGTAIGREKAIQGHKNLLLKTMAGSVQVWGAASAISFSTVRGRPLVSESLHMLIFLLRKEFC